MLSFTHRAIEVADSIDRCSRVPTRTVAAVLTNTNHSAIVCTPARSSSRKRRPNQVTEAIPTAPYWTVGLILFVLVWWLAFILFVPKPGAVFHAHGFLILVGALGALIGNSTAIGGGLVFVPVLILFYDLDPVESLKLAIAAQCFGMTSGAVAWAKGGGIPMRAFRMALPGLLLGSSISTLVIAPNPTLVKGLFGPVSVLVGLLVLALQNRTGLKTDVDRSSGASVMAVAALGGLITGWVAVGEGEIVAAWMMLALGMQSRRAIALGVALLSINSLYLTALHALFLGGAQVELALLLGFGCVFGARLAPETARLFGEKRLKRLFAGIAIADGLLMLGQYLA